MVHRPISPHFRYYSCNFNIKHFNIILGCYLVPDLSLIGLEVLISLHGPSVRTKIEILIYLLNIFVIFIIIPNRHSDNS